MVVKSVEIDIGVKGDADAKAKLDEISKRAEQLKATFPAFALKIDNAAASEKLRVFRAEMADAAKDRTANIKVKVDDSALQKLQKDLQKTADAAKGAGGPAWLGPLLALTPAVGTLGTVAAGAGVALAGAFTAAAGAVGAFGAIAKPVLTDAKAAATAVEAAQNADAAAVAKVTVQYQYAMSVAKTKAQRQAAYAAEQKGFSNAEIAQNAAVAKAYADLSPAQIALSKQLGDMADAWDAVKAAETPVVAGALQPWLKSVTDLTSRLGPIIADVSPVIGQLGTQFDTLIRSPAFTAFRDFIANTGSNAVGAIGGTLIDFVKAFITILPQFDPLIEKAVGWIANLGPAVAAWASSQKTADDITKFMVWFSDNGPVVGDLLKNIGGTLKALAPGLTAGGVTELKLISDFFGWVAKLPPSIAKPLADVAGTLLILNKLGVFSVGVKFVGLAAGWISKLLGGATVDLGAAGMQKAAATMALAAAAMQRAADTMAGAGAAEVTAGTEQGAAGAAEVAAGGLFAGASPAMALLGAGLIAAVAYEAAKSAGNVLNYFKNPSGAAQALGPGGTPPGAFTTLVPKGVGVAAATANAAAAGSPQGLGTINLTAQGKLIEAYALDLQGLNSVFTAQAKTARTAQGALDTYTASVKSSGATSQASKTDAVLLVSELQSVGVNSGKAHADVAAYTAAIVKNGVDSSQAGMARRQVITDILNASANARKGQTDLSSYTTAVQDNGLKSQSAQAARTKLINDLIAAGLDSQTATTWVDGLGASVKNLPDSKTIKITMDGSGLYTITGSLIAQSQGPGGSGNAAGGLAAGGLIRVGTGPTADDVIARLSKGELVVPAHMVRAGAVDHLRGQLPGFASGGAVGNLTPGFVSGMYATFTKDMTDAMVTAMRASIKAAASAAAAAVAGGGGPVSADAAAAQSYARSRLGAYGWAAGQMAPLISLWNEESGWNRLARNPASGAYGIPQALPGSKMGAAANPPTSSAGAQVDWGLGYIKSSYGSPAAAYAFENSHTPHWYDRGGWLPTGLSLAYNATGRPERVISGGADGSQDPLVAELRALRAELRQLTGVAASIPQRTGQHVGAAVNGVAADGSFRRRYP